MNFPQDIRILPKSLETKENNDIHRLSARVPKKMYYDVQEAMGRRHIETIEEAIVDALQLWINTPKWGDKDIRSIAQLFGDIDRSLLTNAVDQTTLKAILLLLSKPEDTADEIVKKILLDYIEERYHSSQK